METISVQAMADVSIGVLGSLIQALELKKVLTRQEADGLLQASEMAYANANMAEQVKVVQHLRKALTAKPAV